MLARMAAAGTAHAKRNPLPTFFLILAVEFVIIPLAVAIWDVTLYMGDPTGATTISYWFARLCYAWPLVPIMLAMGLGFFNGLVVALFVHMCGGMTAPAVVDELAALRAWQAAALASGYHPLGDVLATGPPMLAAPLQLAAPASVGLIDPATGQPCKCHPNEPCWCEPAINSI